MTGINGRISQLFWAMLNCRFKEYEREEFELLGPPHPGEVLREEVLPRLMISRKSLAVQLDISYSTVSRLLNARRRVTSNLAVRLARISGTSALYWLVLQAHHDAWLVQGPSYAGSPIRAYPNGPKRPVSGTRT